MTPADPGGRDLAVLRRQAVPHVLVDRLVEDPGSCSVSVDNLAGGHTAVAHLLAQCHRSIAFVSAHTDLQQIRHRREGALRAIAEAGLPPETLIEITAAQLDIAAGRDAAARLLGLPAQPTAVFCANDLLALGLLQALFAAGVSVPEEIAIVGYDDIKFAAAAAVPLTSVRQPAVEMGRLAGDLLLRKASGEHEGVHEHRHVVLSPEPVVRDLSMHRRANGRGA